MHTTANGRYLAIALLGLAAATAHAEPDTTSAAAMPIPSLKAAHLACEQAIPRPATAPQQVARCAAIWFELLERGFEGDVERLVAWQQAARAEAVASAATLRR